MRSFLAVIICATITLVISMPGVLTAAVFGSLTMDPMVARSVGDNPLRMVMVAAITVFPSLLSGVFSGGIGMLAVKKLLDRVDVVMVVVGASVCVIAWVLAVPLLFPTPAEYPKIIEATAAILAYVLVALATTESLSERPRRGLRVAWMALLAALAVECAVIPMLMIEDAAARISG